METPGERKEFTGANLLQHSGTTTLWGASWKHCWHQSDQLHLLISCLTDTLADQQLTRNFYWSTDWFSSPTDHPVPDNTFKLTWTVTGNNIKDRQTVPNRGRQNFFSPKSMQLTSVHAWIRKKHNYQRTFMEEMGGEQKKRLRRDSKDVDKRCQPNQFEKLDRWQYETSNPQPWEKIIIIKLYFTWHKNTDQKQH